MLDAPRERSISSLMMLVLALALGIAWCQAAAVERHIRYQGAEELLDSPLFVSQFVLGLWKLRALSPLLTTATILHAVSPLLTSKGRRCAQLAVLLEQSWLSSIGIVLLVASFEVRGITHTVRFFLENGVVAEVTNPHIRSVWWSRLLPIVDPRFVGFIVAPLWLTQACFGSPFRVRSGYDLLGRILACIWLVWAILDSFVPS